MAFWKTLIFATLPILVEYYAEEFRKKDKAASYPTAAESDSSYFPHIQSYDFIIVGAGAAGCIIATRLSENVNISVLLLEAGGNPPPQTETSVYSLASTKNSKISYEYWSIPQKYANNTVIRAFQGKLMGGSASVNAMVYNRGHPNDFDNWANITGDDSWQYKNVLKYFKMVENYQGQFPIGAPHFSFAIEIDQHGTDGPITISKQPLSPGREDWLAAGLEKGFQTADPNGPQRISFTPVEFNKRQGKRHSSYIVYLKPIEKYRPNLKIIRYAYVTEILFDEENKNAATGVLYKHHGIPRAAFAKKEIIISAGAYNSPQILMKSGIGPKEILDKAQITVKANLPVGKNFQNHPFARIQFNTQDPSMIITPVKQYSQKAVEEFENNGTGPLTLSYGGLTDQAFLASSVAIAENQGDWPDIQLFHGPISLETSPEGAPLFEHLIHLNRPRSRGFVSINPHDVNGPPIIDFNWCEDKRDIQAFTDAIKFSVNLFENTEVYKRKGVSLTKDPVPACLHLPYRSDSYWECHILNNLIASRHPAGTCRMGKESDPNSVLDTKLRVIGIKHLRVVDASIMPDITNANLQAPVYMIAEKFSAEIKLLWGFNSTIPKEKVFTFKGNGKH